MPAIKLEKFGGMLPAWNDTLLPEGQAAGAVNGYLFSGALIGWRLPKPLYTLQNPNAAAVYRIPTTDDTSLLAPSVFLEFTDSYTDVVKSPVVGEAYNRYYFASPSQTPSYNTLDRMQAAQPPFLLGVPAPTVAPGVTATGGTERVPVGFFSSSTGAANAPGANQIALIPIIASGQGQLEFVVINPTTTNGGADFKPVLYSDNNGVPFSLIAVGPQVTGSVAGTPIQLPFSPDANGNYPILQPQTHYWIGVHMDSNISLQQADTDTAGVTYAASYASGAPPVLAPGSVVGGQPDWWIYGALLGTSVFEARSYVYTYVTAYGEESAPSPVTIVNAWSNATYALTLTPPTTADMGTDRNITTINIYRTVSSQTGQTGYFFVDHVPAATTTYTDTIDDSVVALNNQLLSEFWFAPPADLKGIIAMPNGMIAGFRANEIWFCEPYRPHAWNPNYTLTTEFPIVGLGIVAQSLVACTASDPAMATGINPANMSLTKVRIPEPCISRGSIVSSDAGVFYMSPNGLILVAPTGIGTNVTEAWMTREKWRLLTPPKNVKAIKLASTYFAYGFIFAGDSTYAQQGFNIELSAADAQSFTIWPQPGGHRLGFMPMSSPFGFNVTNLGVDRWTGIGTIIQNGVVYYWDFADQAPSLMPYRWRSKIYQQMAKRNFEVMRVFFNVPRSVPAPTHPRNTSEPQPTLGAGQYGIVRVFTDHNTGDDSKMQLFCTRELRQSGELLRIYSGAKAEMWQFEIEGVVLIQDFQVATSVKELARV